MGLNAVSPGVLLPQEPKGLILSTSVTHLKPTSGPWDSSGEAGILQHRATAVMNAKSQPQDTSGLIIDLYSKETQKAWNLTLFLQMRKLKLGVPYPVPGFVVNNLCSQV